MPASDNATDITTPGSFGALTDDDIRDLYAYPNDLDAPWLRMNFVTSLDGAATIEDSSTGLGTAPDRRLFGLLRELADVVLVGAGTARAEDYGGVRTSEAKRERRLDAGLAAVPPVAIVSATAELDPHSRLFTDTSVPPIVLTTVSAERSNKQALDHAGAHVIEIGDDSVAPIDIRHTLQSLGLLRVLCEGGPTLFGTLATANLVDDLCWTISPVLVGATTHRMLNVDHSLTMRMSRAHAVLDDDGTILTRWLR